MKLALRELRRRPRNFAVPVAILLLLAMLLLYPMAVLDGLNTNSTGALRSLPGELMVFKDSARRSLQRSLVGSDVTAKIGSVPGVAKASPFTVFPLGGTLKDSGEVVGLGIISTERLAGRDAPALGTAYADTSLKAKGVKENSVVLLGPEKAEVRVAGFVEDTNIVLQGGFFVANETFLKIVGQLGAPVFSTNSLAISVTVAAGASATQVARAIDQATGGTTETVPLTDAIAALPGLKQQEDTFAYIRGVTLAVSLLVVALFLSFVTLERMPLYAVLKAVGASSRQLFGGVLAQVLAISLFAVAVAMLVTYLLTVAVPLGGPTIMRPERVLQTAIGLSATAALGACLSLRRVVSVDPASAIG